MLPLRFSWLWLAVGWALVAGVGVGTLMPGDKLVDIAPSDKLLHVGSYFLLMIWFSGIYAARRHVPIALVLVVVGFGLDLLQILTETRTFSVLDVIANGVGVGLGLALARLGLGGWCMRIEQSWFA
jgi:hypothetical protein